MAAKFKTGAAMGSGLPDPSRDSAALSPIPAPAIENKPAPGQTGPKGMAPRTTYSRVNTGSPPVLDAGASAQKGGAPRGMEFLPAKVASSRGSMSITQRPLLQDMLKAAMAGTQQRLAINIEAVRQSTNQGVAKTASAPSQAAQGHVSTEFMHKLAGALGFCSEQLRKEADEGSNDLGPGHGPNSLHVMQAESNEKNIDAGESGQATSANQPPRDPPLQAEKVQQGNAGTGLQTNDEMTHPEQPVSPIKNASANLEARNVERMRKFAAAHLVKKAEGEEAAAPAGGGGEDPRGHLLRRYMLSNPVSAAIEAKPGERLQAGGGALAHLLGQQLGGMALGGAGGAGLGALTSALSGGKIPLGAGASVGGMLGSSLGSAAGAIRGTFGERASDLHALHSKNAGAAPIALLRGLTKKAEDAINPAQISSPASVDPKEPPPGASASGQDVPSEPSDVTSQKNLISSNQAAIDYTKQQAKRDPKSDVSQLLTEPPLSAAHDTVLNRVFDNTSNAGVKISAAQNLTKTAAQVGAQRVLLGRLLKTAAEDADKDKGKDKRSMGMAPTTPQAATGVNAATMGM